MSEALKITTTQAAILRWRLGKLGKHTEAEQHEWICEQCGVHVCSLRDILWSDYERRIVPRLIEAEAKVA